ncbi:UDP-N-acetylglucosamine-N-acetylmuramylpentapeptide N-acetylglucosamine transferase [Halanaerobium saccharolyticum]|uniref:UDP-N-acetylglucosamine--N-acetylmuramyl-(pentapeptide) pyrophosphoryl-undecaprenol N-acetylglucosamine transferase n=1 Tax=Halanaerobium saccharolyticum TaxID=43595 RepID=A0A4R6LHN8_9FIRM|nr:undecaprenyldiphospho-muramoylpentapeptide beta-N-acetylglucosaminyltransferase [Halanaerobium saccharolyticum]TDO83434.1 UDP-N-acetylglucosamine-N-acetylmuramylpentapeptide N-acetylglucosamine transferase [Halanaerobium saccharolyticum]
MKAVITGGGTGGHIYPALAVAEELKKRGWEILYLGSDHRMEAEIVPKAGFDFKKLSVRPLPRKISTKIFSSLFFNTKAFFKALKLIRDFETDFVIGTGGFVAGPVVLAGSLLRKNTIIHEQNAYPGITNKLLAQVVDKVCLNFSEAADYLNVNEDKIEITGNPVRAQIMNVEKAQAYRELHLDPDLKTILITGGSLGAEVINQNVIKLYKYAVQNNIQILHLSGKDNYNQLLTRLKSSNLDLENPLLKVIDYLDEMEYALAVADLIIARAGATGLAEITSCAKPSILIPFAAAAENHQLFNARTLQNNRAAVVIEEADLNEKLLLKKVRMIIENEKKLKSMSAAAESMSQKDSLSNIIRVIEKLGL